MFTSGIKSLILGAAVSLSACVGNGDAVDVLDAGMDADAGELSGEALLGKLLFEDTNLSRSRTQSCASCHSEERGFTGNNRSDDLLFPIALGERPTLFGERNVPTAMYMSFSPTFGFVEDEGDFTPTGGQFWDGRADTLADQAGAPFLNPKEMAMPSKASVVTRVKRSNYAPLFKQLFGDDVFEDVEMAYGYVTLAIQTFENTEAFHPFSSKFDAMLRGEVQFTKQEAHGFSLFKNPEKGNCIGCHAGDEDSKDPRDWLFTDFTYDNLGVPRNREIPVNEDEKHFDLGLCKQENLIERVPNAVEDKAAFVDGLCGAFKVPTLRNIALTAPYMHNGYFAKLRDVVEFYVTRDTNPEKWYPLDEEDNVDKFDDLPNKYKANVNTSEVPYDRELGESPHLNPDEIDDLVAFLRTLSDGYTTKAPN